jgi:hypothetical protein
VNIAVRASGYGQRMQIFKRYTIDELASELVRRRAPESNNGRTLRARWRDHRFYVALGRAKDEQLTPAVLRASGRNP